MMAVLMTVDRTFLCYQSYQTWHYLGNEHLYTMQVVYQDHSTHFTAPGSQFVLNSRYHCNVHQCAVVGLCYSGITTVRTKCHSHQQPSQRDSILYWVTLQLILQRMSIDLLNNALLYQPCLSSQRQFLTVVHSHLQKAIHLEAI